MKNEKYSKYNKYGDGDFSWQEDCMDKIKDSRNVILSSPTGSGKTKVFLDWANNKTEKPIIITAPIKALSNQRYRELLDKGYTVGLETGDIKNIPDDCDFICCTQEIYTNKYVDKKDVTLIMDEFHYIFENNARARTYIDALHNSKANNILLCSATLGNIDKLTKYVEKVSDRKFLTYENDSRATSLFYEGDIFEEDIKDSLVVTFSVRNVHNIIDSLNFIRDEQDTEKLDEIQKLAKKYEIDNKIMLNEADKGIAGYYGSLLPKEKMFIEKLFEKGLIDTVVGTDALALGVNFPVKNVVFAQLAKYYDGPISKNLFEQLAGRAGRKGYFDEGHVYYCSEYSEMEAWGYETNELFEKNLEKDNEDISINLTVNYKDLLLGNRKIKDEAEYICKYSTEEINKNEMISIISENVKNIKEYSFRDEVDRIAREYYGFSDDEYWDCDTEEKEKMDKLSNELYWKNKDAFKQNIGKVYFEEFSIHENCEVFADIICGVDPNEILEKYAYSNNFSKMLQFRKYVKSLPKKYRKGLTKIDDEIRKIDKTAIDGFRGRVSTDEISKQLEKEGRYAKNNIIRVLKEHNLDERADVIEEQLKIAEQYGLEEY